jgi:chemotaxis protein MotB
MAKRRKRQEESGGSWLTTYGDMVTLLLTFFVLLFSFSTIDVVKFKKLILSFQGAIGALPGGQTLQQSSEIFGGATGIDAGDAQRQTQEILEVTRKIQTLISEEGLEKDVSVQVSERGVTISLADQLLFLRGSSDLLPGGKRVLAKLGEILKLVSVPLAVEGHTDSLPLRGGPYKDNWGLSSIRASTVASYLHEGAELSPYRLKAVGYGQYKPLVPNDTEEHMSLNRRVDLVLLSKYAQP